MDFLPENVQTLLQHPTVSFLRTSTQDHLTEHLAHLRSTYVQPYIIEPLSSLLASTSTVAMPDLFSIVLLALVLLISLKVLDYTRRMIMFWVTLAFRLVFWSSILGIGWYVYRVGVENAGRDAGWLWGVVEGFVQDFQARSAAAASAYANPNAYSNAAGAGWDAGAGAGAGRKGKSGGNAWGW
ncbi:Nuclear pore assembly and biogenesis protein APQ12 [Penicillium hispanicum]|uniref:Nuclear pore assembly and biogenesis protein APQ12 n=1 Tax=Penicillium hispanicum TaxID=1080232 RepID=UPI00254230F8|nr:Nuclear pore assembly and biogenesis protein APQ12 [Penicillium hispanicum]KAJ5587644.1 Nuclear pore assembly and biogenesis protein APQ12 [Penicillium hispanicum]